MARKFKYFKILIILAQKFKQMIVRSNIIFGPKIQMLETQTTY